MISANKERATDSLLRYRSEVEEELRSILSWWSAYMPDQQKGGFYGSVNNDNIPDTGAEKGIVLNSRILWTFSAAYGYTKELPYLQMATRAFEYILEKFIDTEYGGVLWAVDSDGGISNGRKQSYGQAFCIYGMAEYFRVTGNEAALFFAQDLYGHLEKYSFDTINGGYVEAFTRDWKEISDLRLSEKDDNARKTMNTHLHIIEAYANLYKIWPEKNLRERIGHLLEIFDNNIINKDTHHLQLFMNNEWEVQSSLISYGHDIEAAWLLQECAEVSGYSLYVDRFRQLAIEIADAAAEGLDTDGGLWYEYELATNTLIREKHSWPQAEAMVGFYNAGQLTGDKRYLDLSQQSWQFIRKNILDTSNGEWFWGITENGTVMVKEKAGFWKCPYHSSRACLEIMKRIDTGTEMPGG
ncbi:MAG: AGE family epimerase/isomerase [Chitinophagaceae bacterium]